MTTTDIERRIAKLARRSARIILELRAEGEHEGAARFEAAVLELVEGMRRRQATSAEVR
jgi:hypothetical protein